MMILKTKKTTTFDVADMWNKVSWTNQKSTKCTEIVYEEANKLK